MRTIVLTAAAVLAMGTTTTQAASHHTRSCSVSRQTACSVRRPSIGFNVQSTNAYAAAVNAQANLIQAQAQYRLQSAQAALENERAQAMRLQNQQTALVMQTQLREANAARQAEKYAKGKASYEAFVKSAKPQATQPLTLAQFNATTGRIVWPAALQESTFASHRMRIEALVKAGAAGDTLQSETDKLAEALHDEIRTASANDYIAAKKFLTQLNASFEQPLPNVMIAGK